MSLLNDDAAARSSALDIRRSFCVQAPAGSGKTELLTQRILCLLAHAEKPEEILAFTFTRKAAAEMRNRLLGYLQEAAAISTEALAALPEHKRLTLQLATKALQRDAQQDWNLLANSKPSAPAICCARRCWCRVRAVRNYRCMSNCWRCCRFS